MFLAAETTYIRSLGSWLSLLAGVDLRRDAPRNLDLYHLDNQNAFTLVTSNNLTLSFVEPFISLDGAFAKYFHYDAGFRQELIQIDNQDFINPQNSFDKLATLTLPKATFTFAPPDGPFLPLVAFSYGEAFHTEDPRIGTGTTMPSLLAPSWAYQLRVSKTIKQFQLNMTLKQVHNSQELAKIDPDTGLQEDLGPSRNRVLAISLQRNFSHGAIYVSYAQADARDLDTGEPRTTSCFGTCKRRASSSTLERSRLAMDSRVSPSKNSVGSTAAVPRWPHVNRRGFPDRQWILRSDSGDDFIRARLLLDGMHRGCAAEIVCQRNLELLLQEMIGTR
jgi:hypothetical protein